ncbi:MAG: TetR/AcrR family transcriptional regulator [Cetobacterium sp.]|uniref:Transcriptional regulator, TetR family n=1 Tax=Cetobacterium ceti TaxID=180163 RepID=A0A1T4Q546_9FUSO|nr:TetR/AcrR family transcriptional regulator [Cetobacterium ceti]MCJ8342000.1 TetR/AcrR family transcriptional regulator [Cetobacterium sp.]SJZ98890.1 transcriptional regulator, TetR family [Cetobacterium ceti]
MKDKRGRIKRTATILFAANGIKNTKIEDIANVLGMAKGGFYYYYKSKDHLLEEIMDDSVEGRKEFLKNIECLNIPFEEKIKMFISRRLNLKDERHNLFLFAKIYENGETNLTYDEYAKRDKIFEYFLIANKEYIKDEYIDEIPKIRAIISSGLTRLLLVLIENTGVEVKGEDSYRKMIERFNRIDIDKEVELFYKLFIKEILK